MKTFMAKPSNIESRWWLVDADGRVLGRMATQIAKILQGKHKPSYTPHLDTGDHVVVVNAAKVKLTGRKIEQKSHQHYTGWVGGQREIPYEEMMEKEPERIIKLAVKRMMPKTALGRTMFKKLRVYPGAEHRHEAQKPEPLDL
jgi:large subunit ribosomal protein L13